MDIMRPTEEQVKEWKRNWEDIYQLTVSDNENEFSHTFTYRDIRRREYNELLLTGKSQEQMEEDICTICTLHPEFDYTSGRAGIATTLATSILESSNLLQGQADAVLSQNREDMMHLDYQVDCIIHEAFPDISLEEISNWTVKKAMYYLSRAEYILMELRGVPLQYLAPEENGNVAPQQQQPQQSQQQQFENNFVSNQNAYEDPYLKQDSSPPKDGELSEEELMNMLAKEEAKHGRKVQPQGSGMGEMMPEMSWFKADEELTGEFD